LCDKTAALQHPSLFSPPQAVGHGAYWFHESTSLLLNRAVS
jgi:hypothetical protein